MEHELDFVSGVVVVVFAVQDVDLSRFQSNVGVVDNEGPDVSVVHRLVPEEPFLVGPMAVQVLLTSDLSFDQDIVA